MIQGSKFWQLTQGDFTPSANKPVYFTGTVKESVADIDWLTWAPGGFGLQTDDSFADFDGWTTANFTALPGVNRLVLNTGTGAYAHVHDNNAFSDLAIDLYDSSTSSWVNVWSYRLNNPYYPNSDSDDYFFNVDVTFPTIDEVTAIRLTSDPTSNDTYHSWDVTGNTVFELYQSPNIITGVNSDIVSEISDLINGGAQIGVFGIMIPKGTIVTSATITESTLALSSHTPTDNQKAYGGLYYYDTARPCAAAGDGAIQAVVCLSESHDDFGFTDASGKEVIIPGGTLVKGFTYYFNIGNITTITDGQFIGYSPI
jgi:hypothetical protein